ncbi:hypothetical protein BC830DRAFT_1080358 [Chytriomyces sp. MP71]|nr:hypothetical protein BC830DRAFT_1080358 [Chytriomyces sp. MP71]
MQPTDPYPDYILHSKPPPNDYYYPRAPTTTITQLPEHKLVYPDPKPPPRTVAERNLRRLENTRGTFGGGVNLDGTSRDKPMIPLPGEPSYVIAKQNAYTKSEPNLIYFGSGEGAMRDVGNQQPRWYPKGLSVTRNTESDATMERKRLIREELAKYERIQLEERDRRRQMERNQPGPTQEKWPFEKPININQRFNHMIPMRQDELVLRELEKKRAEQYARELGIIIHDQQNWMMHTASMPGRRHRVPLEPPRDGSIDLISHVPLPKNPPNEHKKLRPPIAEERKDVYPFAHPVRLEGTDSRNALPTEQTSLPMNRYLIRPPIPIEDGVFALSVAIQTRTSDEPRYGRKKFWLNDEERSTSEQNMRKLRGSQGISVFKRRLGDSLASSRGTAPSTRKRKSEAPRGICARKEENYPWHWGSEMEERKGHPNTHRSTDIVQSVEPIDRDRAMAYQADLDALVKQRSEMHKREKQLDTELWKKRIALVPFVSQLLS